MNTIIRTLVRFLNWRDARNNKRTASPYQRVYKWEEEENYPKRARLYYGDDQY